jgi:transcriptional regulator with XRE-family HTH domain
VVIDERRYGNTHDARLVLNARATLDMSQNEFGELIGMTQGGISLIESRRSPLPYLARRTILQALARHEAMYQIRELEAAPENIPAFSCTGQMLDHERFLLHLPECMTCMARATIMRRTRP